MDSIVEYGEINATEHQKPDGTREVFYDWQGQDALISPAAMYGMGFPTEPRSIFQIGQYTARVVGQVRPPDLEEGEPEGYFSPFLVEKL